MVAGFQRGDAGADLAHDAGAFMAEDRREDAFRVGARQRVGVGVADAGRHDLDQHLAGLRAFDVDGLDGERLAGFPGDRGAGFHDVSPACVRAYWLATAVFVPVRCGIVGRRLRAAALSMHLAQRRAALPARLGRTPTTTRSGVFLQAFFSFAVCALIASGVSASAFDSATISGLSVEAVAVGFEFARARSCRPRRHPRRCRRPDAAARGSARCGRGSGRRGRRLHARLRSGRADRRARIRGRRRARRRAADAAW